MIAHLWTSTLVLALALAAARWMPRLTARTRHAIVLAGLAKFPVWFDIPRHTGGSIVIIGAPERLLKVAPPPHVFWPQFIATAAVAISAALLIAQWIAHLQTRTAAYAQKAPASEREYAAFCRAAYRVGLRRPVNVMRSSIAEAPAVLGVLRPMVILPADRCDSLDDDELESVLLHECAHIARHDNLVAVVRAVLVAGFWFHPLVWLASRQIGRYAEEACDETVAENESAETYLGALTKVCRAAIASPAGISCMAGANLNERMTHLMNYASLRSHALSHRLIIACSLGLIALCTVAGGVRASDTAAYTTAVHVSKSGTDYVVRITVSDTTGDAIAQADLTVAPGATATASSHRDDGREVVVRATVEADGSGHANVKIFRDGKLLQESNSAFVLKSGSPGDSSSISLELRDADLRDVVNTFGKLTNRTVEMPDGMSGKVNAKFVNTPWEKALADILAQNGLTLSLSNGTIVVRRR